jgi:hypothetical protein
MHRGVDDRADRFADAVLDLENLLPTSVLVDEAQIEVVAPLVIVPEDVVDAVVDLVFPEMSLERVREVAQQRRPGLSRNAVHLRWNLDPGNGKAEGGEANVDLVAGNGLDVHRQGGR